MFQECWSVEDFPTKDGRPRLGGERRSVERSFVNSLQISRGWWKRFPWDGVTTVVVTGTPEMRDLRSPDVRLFPRRTSAPGSPRRRLP